MLRPLVNLYAMSCRNCNSWVLREVSNSSPAVPGRKRRMSPLFMKIQCRSNSPGKGGGPVAIPENTEEEGTPGRGRHVKLFGTLRTNANWPPSHQMYRALATRCIRAETTAHLHQPRAQLKKKVAFVRNQEKVLEPSRKNCGLIFLQIDSLS